MRSRLGLIAALLVLAAFAAAYGYSARPGAGWFDSQYLFLVSAPYNATVLRVTGESRFNPDQIGEVLKALAAEAAVAYAAGAVTGAALGGLWRWVRARGRA